jgi:predicted kinase
MEAVIFTGIQAAGKSTFYKTQFFKTHIRINLDMLRTRHREAILFKACLEMKQAFVVDNTNPTPEDRARYIIPAKEAGFSIAGYYFQSRIADCFRRNSERTGKECIPEKGIRATRGRLKIPSFTEGFDALYYVSIGDDNRFIVKEWAK